MPYLHDHFHNIILGRILSEYSENVSNWSAGYLVQSLQHNISCWLQFSNYFLSKAASPCCTSSRRPPAPSSARTGTCWLRKKKFPKYCLLFETLNIIYLAAGFYFVQLRRSRSCKALSIKVRDSKFNFVITGEKIFEKLVHCLPGNKSCTTSLDFLNLRQILSFKI